MKNLLPGLVAVFGLLLLCGCDGEKAPPVNDGKTPVHQQESKKADMAQ